MNRQLPNGSDLRKARFQVGLVLLLVFLCGCFWLGCSSDSPRSPSAKDTPGAKELSHAPIFKATYVADKICADCHQDIWDTYQDVAMAQSAYPFDEANAIEDFENGYLYHKPSNKHYQMAVEDGQLVMTRYRKRPDGTPIHSMKRTVDFVVGSGNHSRTYLYREPSGALYQLPVVWYSQESKWGMAPGYDNANHDDFTRPITRECMFCHNAYPEYEPGSDQHALPDRFPETLPHGIGCQRCHGPGSEHVRIAEIDDSSQYVRTSIVNPDKLDAALQDDVCNQCHFQPAAGRTSFLRTFGKGIYSFKPGEKLSDYQTYFEPSDAEDRNSFEVNHHAYRMYQSSCYMASDGNLKCVTCHDPHAKVAEAERASYYRLKCLNCHGHDECLDVERGRQPDADCAQCHMPRRRTEDVIHVTMTDHKISRPVNADLLAPLKEEKLPADHPFQVYSWFRSAGEPIHTLQEVSRSIARLRDGDAAPARRLYGQIRGGITTEDEPKIELAESLLSVGEATVALEVLDSISESARSKSLVQSNVGLGLIQTGQFAAAIRQLKNAVSLEPVVTEAHFNLGIAYINSGELEKAIQEFEKTVELQPNLASGWFTLASAEMQAQKFESAEVHFQRALEIDPDLANAPMLLAETQRKQEKWLDAIHTLKDGRISSPSDAKITNELMLLTLEAVSKELLDAKESLSLANQVFSATKANRESKLLQCVAWLQNDLHDQAVQLNGSINEDEKDPDRILIAAMGSAKSGQDKLAKQYLELANQQIKKRSQASTRLRTLMLEMANTIIDAETSGEE